MERQSRQVDRRELERGRDTLVYREQALRVLRDSIRATLGIEVATAGPDMFSAKAHESRWIVQAIDNRIASLKESALRKETLMQMLDEQAEQERESVQVNKLDVLFIGGLRV